MATPDTLPPPVPAVPAAAPAAGAALRLPLGVALLVAGALLLAASLAGLVHILLGSTPGAGAVAAALAAAAGTLVVALPLASMLLRQGVPVRPERRAPASAADLAAELRTGAVPRSHLMALAEREWARARRHGTGAAVLLIDIDRFARLCEARGADAGEAVLRELARQTAPTLRSPDVLARCGGAQLAVFLAPADATGALDVADRIRERAEQLDVPWHPERLRCTVSVGVAHLRPAHQSLQAMFDDAQEALVVAHDAGGNCVRAAPVERRRPQPGASRNDDQRTRRQ